MPAYPDPSALQYAHDRLDVYRKAARLLASSLDFDRTLANTIAVCLPVLGDFGFFDVVVGDGVQRTARAHEDPATEALLRPSQWVRQERTDMNLCALSTGRAALHPAIDDAWYRAVAVNDDHLAMLRQLAFGSMLTVPMKRGDELIGSLTLFMARSGRTHSPADLEFAQDLADLAAPIVANVRLLAQQQQADRALRLSEDRLRFVMDAMQQKIFTAKPAGDVDYLNPVWSDYTGLPFEQIRDWGWVQFIHPDDAEKTVARWRRSVATGEPFRLEHRFRRTDGAYRWHLSQARPMRDEAGRVLMWIGSNTEIHDVKMAEAELVERLELEKGHSQLLADVASAASRINAMLSVERIAEVLVEETRHLLHVHQAVVSLTEDERWAQAVAAVSLSDKYAAFRSYAEPADGSGIYAAVCRSNRPMRLTQAELERHPEWKGFGAHARHHPPMRGWLAVPLVGHGGRNLGVIQVSDRYEGEFTEQDEAILVQLAAIAAVGVENARLYDSLREQARRKDEFLAMLAHELRNPLAPIRTAAQLLTLPGLDEPRVRHASTIVARQVDHMVGLVDDLLDVSRVTRGLITLERTAVDLKQVLLSAIEQARPLIESRGHVLTVQTAPAPLPVHGDAVRLVQVVANLLNNAAKFTAGPGEIVLHAAVAGQQAVVSVSDNGMGIEPALLQRIFEPFTQGERGLDRSHGGLGLGLALAKALVELHGGRIHASSEGPDRGSRFTVELPLAGADGPAAAPAMPVQAPAASGPRRITVVDDNADAARMLAELLAAYGHEVTVHLDPHSAIESAEASPSQVYILDIGLPDMDGYDLARELRRRQPEPATFIALSGYGQPGDRAMSAAAGFHHHFVKPVELTQLLEILSLS